MAIQGLQAQAKPKAYTVSELETLDAAAIATFVPRVQAAQQAAGAGLASSCLMMAGPMFLCMSTTSKPPG